jgi:hypothetical protein
MRRTMPRKEATEANPSVV